MTAAATGPPAAMTVRIAPAIAATAPVTGRTAAADGATVRARMIGRTGNAMLRVETTAADSVTGTGSATAVRAVDRATAPVAVATEQATPGGIDPVTDRATIVVATIAVATIVVGPRRDGDRQARAATTIVAVESGTASDATIEAVTGGRIGRETTAPEGRGPTAPVVTRAIDRVDSAATTAEPAIAARVGLAAASAETIVRAVVTSATAAPVATRATTRRAALAATAAPVATRATTTAALVATAARWQPRRQPVWWLPLRWLPRRQPLRWLSGRRLSP